MTRTVAKAALVAAGISGALATAGCADELGDYNEISGHRILAIRATPPEIRPGETATLDALITSEAATHQWSWCPVPFADPGEGDCPLSQQDLQALLQAVGAEAPPPPYDLGSGSTATFEHAFPPALLDGLCTALRDQPLPDGVPRPRCGGRYVITLRLVTESGADSIVGVRDLGLVYDDDYQPNRNPRIEGARIGVPYFDLTGDDPVPVGRGFRYKLELDIPEAAAETYEDLQDGELVTRRESLVVTWFREGGPMDKARSSFLEGTTDFENLTTNYWIAPDDFELERDDMRLYFVLRDNRGGIDWLAADLELVR
jgi:hypothetical protein